VLPFHNIISLCFILTLYSCCIHYLSASVSFLPVPFAYLVNIVWIIWWYTYCCIPLSVWPNLFRGAGHKKRRESSWSGPWHLGCTLEVFYVHSYQDQFIQPGWAECFLYKAFVLCVFICPFWFVCVSPFICVSLSSWLISLSVFGASITNLNEPPRALAASTIAWVRS